MVLDYIFTRWSLTQSTFFRTAKGSALASFAANAVDGYDLFILDAMKAAGVDQIITDDGDYATVDGLKVFTCNRKVLNVARNQRRLMVR